MLFRYMRFASPCGDCDLLAATLGTSIMATLNDIKLALTNLSMDIMAEKAEVAGAVANLTAQILDLRAALNSGTGVTTEDLDSLVLQVAEITSAARDIIVPLVDTPVVDTAVTPPVDELPKIEPTIL